MKGRAFCYSWTPRLDLLEDSLDAALPAAPLRVAPLPAAPLLVAPLRAALLCDASLRIAPLPAAPLRIAPPRAPLADDPFLARYGQWRDAMMPLNCLLY